MKASQRYRLHRLAAELVTPARYGPPLTLAERAWLKQLAR